MWGMISFALCRVRMGERGRGRVSCMRSLDGWVCVRCGFGFGFFGLAGVEGFVAGWLALAVSVENRVVCMETWGFLPIYDYFLLDWL